MKLPASSKSNSGFTLIEVLVTLIIFSIILVITSVFLNSSIDTLELSKLKSKKIKDIGTTSILIRRDFRQATNLPMRYFNYDYDDNHTLISSFGSNKVSFVSLNQTINGFTTNLVEYEFFEDKLLRKQFLTSNPANSNDVYTSTLLTNVSDGKFEFFYSNKWHSYWPVTQNTKPRKILPLLVKVSFKVGSDNYKFLVNPEIKYLYNEE
jgi:type II secretion system protein J